VIPNAISFTFGNGLDTVDELCWTTLQESAHVFGLEHSMLATDAMTYILSPPKKGFIDESACIGAQGCCMPSAECQCGRTMINSHERLATALGLDPDAPAVSIVSPAHGDQVPAGFAIETEVVGMTDVVAVEVRVDTKIVARLTTPPFLYTTDPMLRLGVHTIAVRAEGLYGRSAASPTLSVVRGSPPPPPEPEPEPRVDDGGCSVTRGAGAQLATLVLGVGILIRRRRRSARA
jgi:hypothetical protein